MCGIVGGVSVRNITEILINGLKRLEYRGYDSSGIAMLSDQQISRIRTEGKVQALADVVSANKLCGTMGIAHTRWATHGAPSQQNAHPHKSGDIYLVHNGIIENHQELKTKLEKLGYQLDSDTDTEAAAHLFHYYYQQSGDLLQASMEVAAELKGAYALAIVCKQEPHRIIAMRKGSPLIVGIGYDENYIASDHLALLSVTQQFIYLEEGDIAELSTNNYQIYNANGKLVDRPIKTLDLEHSLSEKGEYRHYMQKEIFEQVRAIQNTLEGRISEQTILDGLAGDKADEVFANVKRIQIAACGTSYHAGMVARYWLEEIAHIPCSVEIASELRYRAVCVEPGTLFVCISQSGETADTLAALKAAKTQGYMATLVICNVPESSMIREAEFALLTKAGIEIGVASTKAFTTQLVALILLTISIGKKRGSLSGEEALFIEPLHQLHSQVEAALQLDQTIADLAEYVSEKQHALFLGRGTQYPIALEGALKMKELSYIHAEAYPAGELKHGPLALVDNNMPVIAIAPSDELLEKLQSNLEEVRSRGGKLIVFTDNPTLFAEKHDVMVIRLAPINRLIAPIVYTIALQLLAYHTAVIRGTDVDQPRNLAKAVTVE